MVNLLILFMFSSILCQYLPSGVISDGLEKKELIAISYIVLFIVKPHTVSDIPTAVMFSIALFVFAKHVEENKKSDRY